MMKTSSFLYLLTLTVSFASPSKGPQNDEWIDAFSAGEGLISITDTEIFWLRAEHYLKLVRKQAGLASERDRNLKKLITSSLADFSDEDELRTVVTNALSEM